MMGVRRTAGLGALLLIGSGLVWASYQPGDNVSPAWFETHEFQIRRILSVPPGLTLEYKGREASEHKGYVIVALELVGGETRQPFELVVSSDGRRLVYDRYYDLADPFAAIVETIRLERSPFLGPEEAPVTIVKYSDYTCGFCRRFYLTMQEKVFERYGGKIRFHHKLLPAVGFRAHAQQSAVAGACAYRQGNDAFWAMHGQLFRNVKRFAEGPGIYAELAAKAGLDAGQFQGCFERRESLVDIASDQEEGYELRIDGTPTFFVNGRPVSGVPSLEYFFEIIDQELALAEQD